MIAHLIAGIGSINCHVCTMKLVLPTCLCSCRWFHVTTSEIVCTNGELTQQDRNLIFKFVWSSKLVYYIFDDIVSLIIMTILPQPFHKVKAVKRRFHRLKDDLWQKCGRISSCPTAFCIFIILPSNADLCILLTPQLKRSNQPFMFNTVISITAYEAISL
jgi:hypothetical protein